jgi:hypothetical protein
MARSSWNKGRRISLIEDLENRAGFLAAKLAWTSGLMILVRNAND